MPRDLKLPGAFSTKTIRSCVHLLLAALPLMIAGCTSSGAEESGQPVLLPVTREIFVHEVTERGEIESSNNVEVRCLVESRNQTGVTIKKLVLEGTVVKAGDVLVELDATALDDEKIQQQIVCNNTAALVTQAENTFKTAKTTLREYEEGTYKQEVQLIQSEIAQAEENLRRARQYLEYSKKLAAKGYITPLQLKADQFAVIKAQNDFAAARTKLEVLETFTRQKMVDQLTAEVETARVRLDSETKSHALDERKLAWIEKQIGRCTITAPVDGQVVFGNSSNRWGQSEVVIQEGLAVREGQVIIRLPDPTQMQVKAKINESRIDLVKPGMTVTVRLDADPETPLKGRVVSVGDYPLPTNMFNSSVKEYGTVVESFAPPSSVRVGMTAEVKILVERQPNVVQAPVQAIVEHGKGHYCLVQSGPQTYKPLPVGIGSTNDKFVIITSGLEPGQSVVTNPRKFIALVEFPESTAPEEEMTAVLPPVSRAPKLQAGVHGALPKGDSADPPPPPPPQGTETSAPTRGTEASAPTRKSTRTAAAEGQPGS